ncbi:DUF4333 domain-containing protein [Pseudonocardia sp. WMMC193]|uniref:DUF4333 domain-containing protein n=1 Tax=Pseudonocardia sp. WMMC193 TaxID=2911965 RepID=UPI001F36F185|nr:DUF4333 domain-containing protein [Pseudonocardia sp. WMMC193]MCF7553821.1 DUF4333 domain-containing protein [Pseudonocardia sp. WMMC193]
MSSVEGSTVEFEVATQAKPVPADVLARSVASHAGQQLGSAIDGAECTGGLEPQVGQSATCTLKNGTETKAVTATVTAIDGGRVEYSVGAA